MKIKCTRFKKRVKKVKATKKTQNGGVICMLYDKKLAKPSVKSVGQSLLPAQASKSVSNPSVKSVGQSLLPAQAPAQASKSVSNPSVKSVGQSLLPVQASKSVSKPVLKTINPTAIQALRDETNNKISLIKFNNNDNLKYYINNCVKLINTELIYKINNIIYKKPNLNFELQPRSIANKDEDIQSYNSLKILNFEPIQYCPKLIVTTKKEDIIIVNGKRTWDYNSVSIEGINYSVGDNLTSKSDGKDYTITKIHKQRNKETYFEFTLTDNNNKELAIKPQEENIFFDYRKKLLHMNTNTKSQAKPSNENKPDKTNPLLNVWIPPPLLTDWSM
jgi:hypothetical protein